MTADPGLERLEVLRAFKRKMPRPDPGGNVSPFDDRIVTATGVGGDADVSDLHAVARQHIADTIRDVRDGRRKSQVILLAGAAGTGKTHLLRAFKTTEAAADFGHVFVGGSNHWAVGEFQARLLDWVIEALTAPSPAQDHPLLDRVRAIGFRTVDHLLANPVSWRACLKRPGGRWLGRLAARLTRPSYDAVRAQAAARDPAVFDRFDFAAFGNYVCDRFLAERSNPLHRFALRVLLTYLFPDRVETGVGTRERVLHWFRGTADDDYFARRLGARERPDREYSRFEAVKLLAHLFSPAVSAQLATDALPCPPRVFLLTFDQAEGRDELFDSDDDWRTFFAHLSELYNTLPNVVVVFTMTLGLRNRLHALMERQFHDRIRMDESFVLRFPTPEQVLRTYRGRVEAWLRDDPLLADAYRRLENPYLPLDRDRVLAVAGNQTMRDTLAALDKAFHAEMAAVAVDAHIDYLFERNALKPAEAEARTEHDYAATHLDTVEELLQAIGPLLCDNAGVCLTKMERVKVENTPVLRMVFEPQGGGAWVAMSLARVGQKFNRPVEALLSGCLANRSKLKNHLRVLRATEFDPDVPAHYVAQVSTGVCGVEVESSFRALCRVAAKRDGYTEPAQQRGFKELVRTEVGRTYLGDLLRHVRLKLDAVASAGGSAEPEPDLTSAT